MPSYSEVFTLGHPAILDIFEDPVYVEEKIDGSQFSFGRVSGEFCCRSKRKDITYDRDKMFNKAYETAYEVVSNFALPANCIIRCEYLERPKHNVLCYNRVPHRHLIVYDIEIDNAPLPYIAKKDMCEKFNLECVPLLHQGKILSSQDVISLMDRESILGGCKIEGMVFKNYQRWTKDKKYYVGKFVAEEFKEKNRHEFKANNPTAKDVVLRLCEELRTEARWQKAVQHLREEGLLCYEPKDIALLIKEVRVDVEKEEKEYIKEELYKHFSRQILSSTIHGLPEWYKVKLMEGVFKDG